MDALEPNGTVDEAKSIGSGATATLSPEHDVDWFFVDVATPGVWLTFTVKPPDASFDPVLAAYAPDLRRLATEDRYGGGVQQLLVVPANEAGRYYLRVSNSQGTRTTTDYQLQSPGNQIEILVFHYDAAPGDSLDLDNVALTKTAP